MRYIRNISAFIKKGTVLSEMNCLDLTGISFTGKSFFGRFKEQLFVDFKEQIRVSSKYELECLLH